MAYPTLVGIAWKVVENFLSEWSQQPYRWNREIDVQVAIAYRLTVACDLIGQGTLIGNYPSVLPGFRPQVWNRVSCEPKVIYTFTDGKQYHCFPDIVIWDDIPDPDNPPDTQEGGFWPILWACEIKYTEGSDYGTWDREKMEFLLDQKIVKFGCWVQMRREVGTGPAWVREMHERFWRCDATVTSRAG